MDGQVLFEGNIRYHISGMRIAILLLMALLAGIVMLLTGIADALDGFILGMLAVFVGLPTAILLLATASRISVVKKRRLQLYPDAVLWEYVSTLSGRPSGVQIPLERISGLETGRDRSLTIIADGKRYTVSDIDNAEDFANAVRQQIRAREQARQLAAQQNLMNRPQNPADQLHAAQYLMQQGMISPEQFGSVQQMQ